MVVMQTSPRRQNSAKATQKFYMGWTKRNAQIYTQCRSRAARLNRPNLRIIWIEVEDDFFHSLCWSGRVFPVHHGLRGILAEHGIAAFDVDLRNGAIRKHGRVQSNLTLKMAGLQHGRILRFDHHHCLATGLRSVLRMNRNAGQATKQRYSRQQDRKTNAHETTLSTMRTHDHRVTPKEISRPGEPRFSSVDGGNPQTR